MGKKTASWLSTVKKVFKPFKDYSSPTFSSHRRWEREAEVEGNETAEIVSVEHFPTETSPEATNTDDDCGGGGGSDEEREQAIASATATAADAAVAAAEAAARVVRLAGYRRPLREERAAVLIQSVYRGYLARRALRALRGLVRLQALVRGHQVRKQALLTMRCMQSLVRVQALARTRRHYLARKHNHLLFSHFSTSADATTTKLDHTKRRGGPKDHDVNFHILAEDIIEEDEGGSHPFYDVKSPRLKTFGSIQEWDGRHHSLEASKANSQRKHDAVIRRERALAYAYTYQQQQQQWEKQEHEKAQWGWNWLERWMAAQQWDAQLGASVPQAPPPVSSYVTATMTTDELSEKTVEMDTGLQSPSNHVRPAGAAPSYMAATQSAKAKVHSQKPVTKRNEIRTWNTSIRRVNWLSGDSTSSGGGSSGTNLTIRSPSRNGIGVRLQTQRHNDTGYSPDSSCGGDGWTPPFGARSRRSAIL